MTKKNEEKKLNSEDVLQIQFELMKVIAEQEQERLFEYNKKTDRATLYKVVNGNYTVIQSFEKYQKNLDSYLFEYDKKDVTTYKKALQKCLKKTCNVVFEIRGALNGNEPEWYRIFLASIAGEDGNVNCVAGRIINIQKQKEFEASIKKKAEIDALTGVYNHKTFEALCEKKLKDLKSEVIFLMLDVDDFKIINDTLGHNVGDMILAQTGNTLNINVGEKGIAGRLGGDDFALLAWGFKNPDLVNSFCKTLVMNLKNIIFDMEYSASIGISVRNGRNMTFMDMYYEADQAVYAAKKRGKNQLVMYSDIVKNKSNNGVSTTPNLFYNHKNTENLTEYEKYSYNERPEYILVIDTGTNRILFANKAAREASILPASKFDEYIENGVPNNFFEDIIARKECGQRYFVHQGASSGEEVLDKIFGSKNLLVRISHRDKNETRHLTITDLSDSKHYNTVFRKYYSNNEVIRRGIKTIKNEMVKHTFLDSLTELRKYYDADVAALIYDGNEINSECQEVHSDNAATMSRLFKSEVESGQINSFSSLYEESDHVLIGNMQSIKIKYPRLYIKIVDCKIWSIISVKVTVEGKKYGNVILLNPRSNTGELNFLDMHALFYGLAILRKQREDEVELSLGHDAVTGLRLYKNMNNLGSSFEEYEFNSMGVLSIDIINLEQINKENGFEYGNTRLKEVSNALCEIFVGFDIFRLENSEMMVFCKNIDEVPFRNMVRFFREKLDELSIAVSIGYSWTKNVNLLRQVKEAREARLLDRGKILGTDKLQEIMNEKVRKEVLNEILGGKVLVYLQPKVNIRTGKTVGAEALIRQESSELGIVGPIHFIDRLESCNAIHLVDLFVLEEVCLMQRNRIDNGLKVVPISVNFSKVTLLYVNLVETVKEIIGRYDLPKEIIQIEITESVSDMDQVILRNIANSLRSMGFVLAMDDFGTKYSNIATLVQFQFGVAKIDRSLVKDIAKNPKSFIVLKHLTAMINEIGLECVIEGAEDQEQIDLLKELECDIIQGYYYSKPIPKEQFFMKFLD